MAVEPPRIITGIAGLDEILGGGLPHNHMYLLQGPPGSGKTTLGMQFLLEGVRQGEKTLYVTLLHSEENVRETAFSHGWNLSGMEIAVLFNPAESESLLAEQTLLPNYEVQLNDVLEAFKKTIEKIQPVRLFFDSLEQFRLLSADAVIFRQKVLAIQQMLNSLKVTSLFVQTEDHGPELKTLANGLINLDMTIPPFGEFRRRIMVEKMRGIRFTGGYHAMRIRSGGIEAYPRLPLAASHPAAEWKLIPSGSSRLDEMLGGGLEEGTTCFITGESGTGKSTLAALYAQQMAARGKHVHILLFTRRISSFIKTTKGLGMDIEPLMDQGFIFLQKVDLLDISAGELAHHLRMSVEKNSTELVIFDSLTGYYSVPEQEPQPTSRLHEMLVYLGQHNVLTLLLHDEINPLSKLPGEISIDYLADSILQLRRFEARGILRLAISVLKKRHGSHGNEIRELRITAGGIKIGEPLKDFTGILSGNPVYIGREKNLLDNVHGA